MEIKINSSRKITVTRTESTGFRKGKLLAQLLRRIRIQTQIFVLFHLAYCLEK